MGSVEYFIWIGICVVIILALLFLSLKFKFSFKTSSIIMSCIALASELCKIFTHMEPAKGGGMVISAGALPLHLCSILIFVIFYLTFTKNDKLKNTLVSFLVPIGLVGGLMAILMATSGTNFKEPYAYQCFIYHAGIVWYALYLICSKQVDLGFKAYVTNLIILFAFAFTMIWVNGALQQYDTNFLYVVRPPAKGLPLLNLDHGWYVYFLTLSFAGFLMLTFVHFVPVVKALGAKMRVYNER